MRILSRHVLFRFLTWFVLCFALLLGVAAAADLLIEFERVRDVEGGGLNSVIYLLMRLPAMHFQYLIPIAAFAAALFTLGTASLGLEVIAAKSGGISPHSLAAPVLAGALGLAGLTALVNDTLVVRATRFIQYPAGGGNTPEIVFRSGSFWYHTGRTIYNIRRADPSRKALHGVSVYERDDADRLVRSIHARKATIEGSDAWRFHDATIRRFDPGRPADMPEFERLEEIVLEVADDPELEVLEADPSVLSLADLASYIAARQDEGEEPVAFRAIFHQRLAAPLTVLLFALLAIPPALRAEQTRTLATPALQGVALLVVFWFADAIAKMLASNGVAGTELASWWILAAFLAIGGWQMSRVPA